MNIAHSRLRPGAMPIHAMMVGSLFSNFGNQLTALAVPWFVLETTGSASKTGLIAAVTLLPMILSMLFGGTLADRVQQKYLAIGSDVISGLTIAAVPLFYSTTGLSFAGLVVLMFLGAIFDSPGGTARSAMIPALSRRADISLEQVNSRFGAIGSATQLFGAPIAGLLIAVMGAANVLWLNAATFAISAMLVLVFVPMAARAKASGNSFVSDVRQGFAYFLTKRVLLAVALLATAINFLLSPLFGVALPYFAKTVYESSAKLGLMMGAAGLGGLAGALAYGHIGLRWSRRTVMLTAMGCFGIPIWIMALQPPVEVICGLLLVMGFGGGLVNPMVSTMLQIGTPEHMLGRVLGTLSSIAMLASPLGMILGGGVIGAFGLNTAIIGTAALFSALLLIGFANPIFRELDHLDRDPETPIVSAGSAIPDPSFAASDS